MPVRNQNFYDLQSSRRYPLDDSSTGTADDGTRLRDSILVDCHLRFPRDVGNIAYVGGITVTDRVVTVVFLAADAADATDSFVPLAAVTLVKPVIRNQQYAVEALQPGVGGWVVFGDGVAEPFTARFATPRQGLLAQRCARPYRELPVTSLGKQHRSTSLTDLITIKGGSDVEVVRELVTINTEERAALVFRLTQASLNRNTLATYVGPCERRPESNNCEKPGIEFINGVAPDANGNLNILFPGVLDGPYEDCGGVTLDHSLGLGDVCDRPEPPPDGLRYRDLCEPGSESSTSLSESSESMTSESSLLASSESEAVVCDELPICESFDASTAPGFTVRTGEFAFEAHDSPGENCTETSESSTVADNVSYAAVAAFSRNVATITHCGSDSLDKRCIVELQLTANAPHRNGGIVVNWHVVDPLTNPRVQYFLIAIDHNVSRLRIYRFTGNGFIIEAETSVLPIVLEHWYRLQVTTSQLSPTQVALQAQISGVTDPLFPTTTLTVSSTKYLPADGYFGVGTNQAHARFSFFKLEEA